MAEQPDENRTLAKLATAAIIMGVGLGFYVLSIGPMYWFCRNSRHEIVGPQGEVFVRVYAPVIWLYQNGPQPVRSTIGRYLEIFEK